MAINNVFPLLNGVAPSWADITVNASGGGLALINMTDIQSINTSTTVEVGTKEGASGGRDTARTTGKVTYEASVVLYRDGYQKLLRSLKIAAQTQGNVRGNQVAISLVHFNFQMLHTPFGSLEIFDRRIKGCRLLGNTMAMAEGTEADTVEVPLSPNQIVDMIDGQEVVML